MKQLLINDWCPMNCAPLDATEVEVELPDHSILLAHWASDLSGEEQPPFEGWFKAVRDSSNRVSFYASIKKPIAWRPKR